MFRTICLSAICLVSLGNNAVAFDTGHHSDLTRAAMMEFSFSDDSIRTAQVANWLTDYYSSNKAFPDIQDECQKLHFDNLYSNKDVTWYWQQLTDNIRVATVDAAETKDKAKMLAVLGISLHAVQDFYSHSNWVESHPRIAGAAYRTETWWSAGAPSGVSLTTGKYEPYPSPPPSNVPEHGGYHSGLNKDSYVRPKWDEAYVFAYCACCQLVGSMEQWANQEQPGFWNSVTQFSLGDSERKKIAKDFKAAYEVSLWVAGLAGADGHWKGNLSGSKDEFATATVRFAASANSIMVKQFRDKDTHKLLSKGLYSGPPPSTVNTIVAYNLKRQVVSVRITRVSEKDDVGTFERKIDPGGTADFYANVQIGSRSFVERTAQNKQTVNNLSWTICFCDRTLTSLPIVVGIVDEDLDADDVCDLSPKVGQADLRFNFHFSNQSLSGDLTGVHATPASAAKSSGEKPDKDRAEIELIANRTLVGS